MFESLTDRLSNTFRKITGKSKLSEKNINDALKEVRKALIEADCAWDAVKTFIAKVKESAVGREVGKKLTPSQEFFKVVNEELKELLGGDSAELRLGSKPAIILVAGLQGSGKTTTIGKIAKHLQESKKLKVAVTSCDIYRPAAIDQLETVAGQVGATFFPSNPSEKPVDIANRAVVETKKSHLDVLLVDTAGRLHIDDAMMSEAKDIHNSINPSDTLFVVDGMTGQDAAKTAQAFNETLELTGVVLTKLDGDSRGGAALSVRHITGKPIMFMGLGEKLDAIETFHPERIASRILGMGDILSLIEQVEKTVDKEKAERVAKKISKGKGLDLNDLRDQFVQMQSMGGLSGMMDKLPGMNGQMKEMVSGKLNDKQFVHMIAIIDSMTKKERSNPALLNGSRKRRIAEGSGTDLPKINRLLKQHTQMQKMLKKVGGKGSMSKMLDKMKGQLPPGMLG